MNNRTALLAAALALSAASLSWANTIDWAGSTGDYSTSANWLGGNPPAAGDTGLIISGNAQVNSTALPGNPAIQVNPGATFSLLNGDAANPLTLNGGTLFGRYGHNLNSLLTVTADSQITHDYGLNLNGGITGAGRITTSNAPDNGVLVISGNNSSWSGGLTITSGTARILVDGGLGSGMAALHSSAILDFDYASNYNVANTLTGSGTLYTAYSKNVLFSGSLAPGTPAAAATLAISGFGTSAASHFTYAPGAIFQANLNSASSYDILHYTDSHAGSLADPHTDVANLTNLTLSAALNYAPTASDELFIVQNDGTAPITGTFTGLAQDATVNLGRFTAEITYTADSATKALTGGNDVALFNFAPAFLSTVPEPATLSLGAIALCGLAFLTRRRT